MSVALLVAWLLVGIGQDVWWDFGGAPIDVNAGETTDVRKMDGPDEIPPKP